MVRERIGIDAGMDVDTACKYVALRKAIDSKLKEIEDLGRIIEALCFEDVNIYQECIGSLGAIIRRNVNETWEKLDEFLEPHYLELTLKEGAL